MQSKQLLKKYLNVIKGKLRSNTLLYQLSQNSIAMVWGNKVGTMLLIQVWGPEFQSLAPTQKLGVVVYACIINTGNVETAVADTSLTSQPI